MSTALVAIGNKLADRFGLGASDDLIQVLRATAFKSETPATDAQLTALLIVAQQYGLNPWTKEIYAYPDKKNGIVAVVGVDGWSRIINENPQFDGVEFHEAPDRIRIDDHSKECPAWIDCEIFRKDRSHATRVREYLDETYRPPYKKDGPNGYVVSGPWQTHTKRLLRHKSLIQSARIAFGFVGIYDQDEAERIIEAQATTVTARIEPPTPEEIQARQAAKRKADHDEALARHSESVAFIKKCLGDGKDADAYNEYMLIPEHDRIALGLAPSKGGCFTTAEGKAMTAIISAAMKETRAKVEAADAAEADKAILAGAPQ